MPDHDLSADRVALRRVSRLLERLDRLQAVVDAADAWVCQAPGNEATATALIAALEKCPGTRCNREAMEAYSTSNESTALPGLALSKLLDVAERMLWFKEEAEKFRKANPGYAPFGRDLDVEGT